MGGWTQGPLAAFQRLLVHLLDYYIERSSIDVYPALLEYPQ